MGSMDQMPSDKAPQESDSVELEPVSLENARSIEELIALSRHESNYVGGEFDMDEVEGHLKAMKDVLDNEETEFARTTWLGIMNNKKLPDAFADAAFRIWKESHAEE